MESKTCTRCGVTKIANTDNFVKNKYGKYGLKSICKSCTNKNNPKKSEEEKRARRNYLQYFRKERPNPSCELYKYCKGCGKEYLKHIDNFHLKTHKQVLKNGEVKVYYVFCHKCRKCINSEIASYKRLKYKENPIPELLRNKKYRENNREKTRRASANWYSKNKERQRNYDQQRLKDLPESMIINRLKSQTKLSKSDILKNPELIESKRILTLLKREIGIDRAKKFE